MTASAAWDTLYYGYTLSTTMTGTIGWWRTTSWPDGRVLSVSVGKGNPFKDTLVPLSPGGVHTWYAQSSLGPQEQVGGVETPPIAECVLSIPSDPEQQAQQVVVQTAREWTVTGRTAVYEILGKNVPWVEPEPPIERRGQLVLRMEHPGGGFPGSVLDGVRDMLKTGKPMLLRTVCPERVETVSFVATAITEVHLGNPNAHGPGRLVDISWQAVEPLYGEDVAVARRLWFQVPMEFTSWNDLAAEGLSWDSLAWGTT